jgi:hypothetical protein
LAAQEAKPTEAKAAAPAKVEDTGTYDNAIELGVGNFWVNGDKSQFQRRRNQPGTTFGGIEEFHWEKALGQKGLFQVDGKALFNSHDYLLKLEVSHPDKGYLRAGYREYRTWYDASGGFFPKNDAFFPSIREDLWVDRGSIYLEGGLKLPEIPQVTFRYEHLFRKGAKDSIIWGDATMAGLAVNPQRGVVPTFWTLDEKRDSFALDAKHTVASTDFGVGVRYEMIKSDDARKEHRRPNEASDRYVTQREGFDEDLFNVHGFTETRFNERLLLTAGASFTTLDTDVTGSRIYGGGYEAVYDPLFARRQFRDEGFFGLSGGSKIDQYVMNLNLMATPWDHVTIVPALRVEKQDQSGLTRFVETAVGAGPAFVTAEDTLLNRRARSFVDVTGSLEARYTGWRNWVLYCRGEWLRGEGNLGETETDLTTGTVGVNRDTDSSRLVQKYSAGAHWYPLRSVSLSGQYYHKTRKNDYDHITDSTPNTGGDRYPAFLRDQNFTTDDMNIRVTWRPFNAITLVSRYDFQLSTVDTRGDLLALVQSAETTSHILSQSISWTPLSRLYLQGSINYSLDQTETPITSWLNGNAAVLPSKNNYWNASASCGYALNDKTDVEGQYFYYRSDNFVDNSAFSQPYGAATEEHGVTVSLIRRITERVRCTLRYGFFRNRDDTFGGRNNYDAHLVSSTIQYRF